MDMNDDILESAGGLISPNEIFRISWEGVVRNKVRSLLTMLGVIIGVAAVIIMIGISQGTEAAIAEQINGLGANLAFIQSSFGRGGRGGGGGNTPSLVYSDLDIVKDINGVVATSVEQTSTQDVRSDSGSLTGVDRKSVV